MLKEQQNDITSVIMTGGSMRTPMIQAAVKAAVGEFVRYNLLISPLLTFSQGQTRLQRQRRRVRGLGRSSLRCEPQSPVQDQEHQDIGHQRARRASHVLRGCHRGEREAADDHHGRVPCWLEAGHEEDDDVQAEGGLQHLLGLQEPGRTVSFFPPIL